MQRLIALPRSCQLVPLRSGACGLMVVGFLKLDNFGSSWCMVRPAPEGLFSTYLLLEMQFCTLLQPVLLPRRHDHAPGNSCS